MFYIPLLLSTFESFLLLLVLYPCYPVLTIQFSHKIISFPVGVVAAPFIMFVLIESQIQTIPLYTKFRFTYKIIY